MAGEHYVLRSTLTSPFGRKVRMAAAVLGVSDRLDIVPADTLNEDDSLRQQNPLGKMPCLLLADGGAIYGSAVIIEFLETLAAGKRLTPEHGPARFRTLTLATLADGITEAGLLMVYESRFRDPGQQSERWLAHQRGKITRALRFFEKAPPDPARTDLVAIGLSCALDYLDWRKPMQWRGDFPGMVAWLDAFARHEPAYSLTRAPLMVQ